MAWDYSGDPSLPDEPRTGLILAGGGSRRMGRDKAFLELGGRPLIEIVMERLGRACDEILIVASDPDPYRHLQAPVVSDVFSSVGVLAGLHAGLAAASHNLVVAVGCDMPFLVPALLRAFGDWASGYDVVVLRQGEHVEPLHGAYRRTCVGPIQDAILAGERRVVSFFPRVRVRYVGPADVVRFDISMRFVRNVNTPEQWQVVQAEWAASEELITR